MAHTFKIFYCYAHEDEALREQLARHLSPLRRIRYITGWFNRDIPAGTNWQQESKTQLDSANIILLLVSANFMASDYCYTVEMARALERHKAGTACVIPILLRPVEWEKTPIGELSALPTGKKPVTQWTDQDEAWLNVVQGISEVIRNLLPVQELSPQDTNILYPEIGPLSGQTVGEKYLLGELIGEGGFSQVYKARHLHIQREQAIKVLLERHFRKPAFRDRFLREAQTVASLDHPYIIHIDDFWVEASQAYLVMPFISGGTLQDILEKQPGFLKLEQIVSYLEYICAALQYAHDQEVAHLDLKPLNLLVHENGQLLLSDFGLAHLMKQGAIEGGSSLRVGTPHYMAPEHIQGAPEKRSDIFSLGVILYQMLVGRLPFDGLPQETIILKTITEWPPAPRTLRPELPKSVEDMLAKALAKLPEQRYQTANEFLSAFKNALAHNLPVLASVPPQQKNPLDIQQAQYNKPLQANIPQDAKKDLSPKERQPDLAVPHRPILTPNLPPAAIQAKAGNNTSSKIELLAARYQLQDPIGRGTMATIYRGRDLNLDCVVAIKVLQEAHNTNPEIVASFQREAKAVSSLDHPNVVPLYDYGVSDGTRFIVMELIEGVNLRRYLRSRGILRNDYAIIIAHDIALGLGAAHLASIVHRDVKPENVLTGRDGSIKLIDFGNAIFEKDSHNERSTPNKMIAGPPIQYCSPEQTRGSSATPASDIYALGIIMYEMSTGRTPFDADTPLAIAVQHVQNLPLPPSQLNANIPPLMEKVILRCLEKEPEKRYRDGSQLARALEELGE